MNSVISLFAGAGGIDLGFENTGVFHTIYANEFDKYANKTYAANFANTILDGRSIRDVTVSDIQSAINQTSVDVLTAGFPCQPFSISGYRQGFSDPRGDLFFETLRIIKGLEPKVVFLENVKNLVTHDDGNTFRVIREALTHAGYHIKWQVMNAKVYGNIPQNRERIYVIGFKDRQAYLDFEFPDAIPMTTQIQDVVDFDSKSIPAKYFYTPENFKQFDVLDNDMVNVGSIYQWRRQYVRENKSGVSPTLTANMGTGGHNVPLIRTSYGAIRKLTPRETFNIDGYPSDYVLPNVLSDGRLYKQAGNSVAIPVITRIAEAIFKVLPQTDKSLPTSKPYSVAVTKMIGAGKGESETYQYADSQADAKQLIAGQALSEVSIDEYVKAVHKKNLSEFVTVVG